jgi:transcriptional regulator with XRE-family HTH domain
MPATGSPTVRRLRLAAELRRLRIDARKTAEDVGRILGWSKAKVSRYELGQSGLKPVDVARLLDVYRVQDKRRDQLLALAEEATLKGWWESYSDVLTEGHIAFIGLEAEATTILGWHINVIPGLLQTEQYAREILSGYNEVAPISPRTIERRLETRLIRQHLLDRHEPPEYVALLDESVLYRQHGDRPVMRSQLGRLADAAELPSVTIRILPLQRSRGLATDSFVILKFGKAHETALHNVVSIEHLSSSQLYVEGDADTHTYELAFRHLEKISLPPSDSRELIMTASRQVWGGP